MILRTKLPIFQENEESLRWTNNIPKKHIRGPLKPCNSMNGENVRSIVAPLYQSSLSRTTDIFFIRPPTCMQSSLDNPICNYVMDNKNSINLTFSQTCFLLLIPWSNLPGVKILKSFLLGTM